MSGQVVTDAKTANSAEAPRVAAAALATFIKRAFEAAGLRSEDADVVANLMVEADLRGSDTHGVIRLPLYLRRLRAGGIKARPNIRVAQERAATALVDGDNGIGHLVMRFAAMTAIEKAKAAGVAWVGARMSNHAGPAALYAMMPLAHDMVGSISPSAATTTCRRGARPRTCWARTRSQSQSRPKTKQRSCSIWHRLLPPSERCA